MWGMAVLGILVWGTAVLGILVWGMAVLVWGTAVLGILVWGTPVLGILVCSAGHAGRIAAPRGCCAGGVGMEQSGSWAGWLWGCWCCGG